MPSVVTEELKTSTDLKGELSVQDFLRTEVGKNTLTRKLAEYRSAPKNSQRKLKDLLAYLDGQHFLRRFGGSLLFKSPDLKKLDDATELLTKTYDVGLNPSKLSALRDKLLRQQINDLEQDLRSLHGLVLVEGDWGLDIEPDRYRFRRPFLESVTNPPICEVSLAKSDVSPRNKQRIETARGKPIRLYIFGDVLVGISGKSKTVEVSPIAVF